MFSLKVKNRYLLKSQHNKIFVENEKNRNLKKMWQRRLSLKNILFFRSLRIAII